MSPFTGLIKNSCLNKSKFSSVLTVFKHVKKTNFLGVIFGLKIEVLCECPQKCFKTTEKHSLAVCGSHWEQKQFLLIFVPFYRLIKNSCVNKSKFSSVLTLSNMLRKTNFLSVSVLFSERVIFGLKIEVLCKFPQKYFKTTEKHSLSVCGSLWGEKQFWLILSPFNGFVRNSCLTNPKIFQVLPLFKHVKENKLSEFFSFPFWDSHLLDKKDKISVNFPKNALKQQKSKV